MRLERSSPSPAGPWSGCAATSSSQSNKVPTARLSQARMVLPYSRELADAVLNGVTPLNEALEHSFQPCVGSRTRPLPNGLKNTLGKRKSSVLQLNAVVAIKNPLAMNVASSRVVDLPSFFHCCQRVDSANICMQFQPNSRPFAFCGENTFLESTFR